MKPASGLESNLETETQPSGAADRHGTATSSTASWDGEDDPQNPKNWPVVKKWSNLLVIACLTFISPFGSSMLAPSTSQAMREFHSTNVDLQSFSVSIFVLGYAFGPLVHAPLSELYGRVILYHINSVLFIVANIACALSTNLSMLIVFRLISGLVGSCPLALGPAFVGDCFKQEQRGRAIAVWNLPILLGPAIGPLVGSYLGVAMGWRWNFWLLAIAMGAFGILGLAILRESHAPTILSCKARQLQLLHEKNPEEGRLKTISDHDQQGTNRKKKTLLLAITRPIQMLFCSPIVFSLSLLTAVHYGIIYILFTTMSSTFRKRYGMSENTVGLTYLAFGIGNISGNIFLSIFSDRLLQAKASRNNGELKPEYRLPPLIPGSVLVPAGLLVYGWTLNHNVHWIVPLIGMVLVGLGGIFIFVPVNTYLVDAYTEHAASATAANTVLRSLGGGLLPLCGAKMYQAVGDGWGNTILAFAGIAFIPLVWFIYRYGERLRTSYILKLK